MFLYLFKSDYQKFIIQSISGWMIKLENMEPVPIESFSDFLLTEDDLPLDMAHSIWESRCYK